MAGPLRLQVVEDQYKEGPGGEPMDQHSGMWKLDLDHFRRILHKHAANAPPRKAANVPSLTSAPMVKETVTGTRSVTTRLSADRTTVETSTPPTLPQTAALSELATLQVIRQL